MPNAVIYARFSSDRQTEDSIAAQVRACREYAASHGLQVSAVYADEAISGKGSKTVSRMQYQRMLRDAQKGKFDTILCHKYDRIARNLGEHVNLEARLKDWDVELIATAQDFGHTNESKILRALVWSMSEYYIDNLANESRKGLRETALRAEHTGGVAPFGYDIVDKHYVINELEAAYVRKMFDCAQHREGFTGLLAEMNAAGIVGKRGKPMRYPQVYEILHNEKYTGTYLYCPEEAKRRTERRNKPGAIRIENALPAIVSRAQFEEVQKIMAERKQTGRKGNYLCGGLVYCRCGAKMHAMSPTRKGHTYHYYSCSAHCGAPTVDIDDVDAAARQYLRELLHEENQQAIEKALRGYMVKEGLSKSDFQAALKKHIAEKQKQYDALMSNLSVGALPAEVVADIGSRMQALKAEIAALETAEPPVDHVADTIRDWLQNLRTAPNTQAVRLLIERIDVQQSDDRDKAKTAFNIQSTLKTVLGENGCGGRT